MPIILIEGAYTIPPDGTVAPIAPPVAGGGVGGTPVTSGAGTVSVTDPVAFLNTSGKVAGSRAFVRQVGGTAPSFTGYKEYSGNLGFDSTAGAVNIINLFYDGVDHWYYIGGQVGATAAPAATQTLTNFRTNAAGTQLLFDNSGTALTAFNGTVSVAGSARALTFVNATTASFTPAATSGQAITVTLTSTTPAIPVAVTSVAVTNNVTSGLAKKTLTFPASPAVTLAGDLVQFAAGGVVKINETLVAANSFEIWGKLNASAQAIVTSAVPPTSTSWPPIGPERLFGTFQNGAQTEFYEASGQTNAPGSAIPLFFKFIKNGNDVQLLTGTSYTNVALVKTFTGVLASVTTIYISLFEVSGSTAFSNEIQVYQ